MAKFGIWLGNMIHRKARRRITNYTEMITQIAGDNFTLHSHSHTRTHSQFEDGDGSSDFSFVKSFPSHLTHFSHIIFSTTRQRCKVAFCFASE